PTPLIAIRTGDTVEIAGVRVTLHSFEAFKETNEFSLGYVPRLHQFYVADLTVENIDLPTFTFNNLNLSLQTEEGFLREYERSSEMSNQANLPEIRAFEFVRQKVSFVLDPKEKPFRLIFDHPSYRQDAFVFNLSK
ncbi:MAG: DUF4352 domain-containing protein, partial [Chloroflexi bacterium]|nr:DUF4352 domain-containing protein [Chloroflexota bacterium]